MATPCDGTRPLVHAIQYALGSLEYVTPGLLSRPTPCAAWDLATLLQHVGDSLAAFHEGIATGYVDLDPAGDTANDPLGQLVATVRDRTDRLLAASVMAGYQDRSIIIADRCLVGSVLTAVGTVEIAVHGWDVAQASGRDRPIPAALATSILDVLPLVVTDMTRDVHFATPVTVLPSATPSDRVVALLGRSPSALSAAGLE